MSNWHNVLRAINMASSKFMVYLRAFVYFYNGGTVLTRYTAKLAKPSGDDDTPQLPQTLVRIPTEHAPALQAQADAAAEAEAEQKQETP